MYRPRHEMEYDIELATVGACPTAVGAASTTWERFPTLWRELLDPVWAFLRGDDPTAAGLWTGGHNVMLYKDDVPNVEVGVQVTGPFPPHGAVAPSVLPAGRVARTVHRGGYATLNDAHLAIRAWCAERGIALTGARWEVYGDPPAVEVEVSYLLA